MTRHRYVVESIPEDRAEFIAGLDVKEGDVLIVGEGGFPHGPDLPDPPRTSLVRGREVHPNIAWVVGELGLAEGFLREIEEGEVTHG